MIPFVTTYADIVTAVETAHGSNVEYMYGHPLEIVNILQEKSGNDTLKFTKYPLIAVFQDFEEDANKEHGFDIPSLTVIIAVQTSVKYKAAQRYSTNFVPVLYPLLDLLIAKMSVSTDIDWQVHDYSKFDRLFWGKEGLYGNTANIFNDAIDAIEIRFKNIKELKKC